MVIQEAIQEVINYYCQSQYFSEFTITKWLVGGSPAKIHVFVYIYNSHRLHRKYSSQDNHIFGHIWTFWIGSTDKIVILIWKLPPILTWQKPSWECWKTTNFLQGIAPNPMDMMGSHLSGPIQHISGWPFTGRDEGNPYIFPSLSVVCLKDFLNVRPPPSLRIIQRGP